MFCWSCRDGKEQGGWWWETETRDTQSGKKERMGTRWRTLHGDVDAVLEQRGTVQSEGRRECQEQVGIQERKD